LEGELESWSEELLAATNVALKRREN